MGKVLTAQARLLHSAGPILKEQVVDGFTLTSTAKDYLNIVDILSDGSLVLEAELVMTPMVPDIDIVLTCFSPGETFTDSNIKKNISSNDFDANGRYKYNIIVTNHVCHSIKAFQDGWKLR